MCLNVFLLGLYNVFVFFIFFDGDEKRIVWVTSSGHRKNKQNRIVIPPTLKTKTPSSFRKSSVATPKSLFSKTIILVTRTFNSELEIGTGHLCASFTVYYLSTPGRINISLEMSFKGTLQNLWEKKKTSSKITDLHKTYTV